MIDHNAQGWRLNTWKEVKEVIVEAMQKGNMFISEADVNNYYFSDTDKIGSSTNGNCHQLHGATNI